MNQFVLSVFLPPLLSASFLTRVDIWLKVYWFKLGSGAPINNMKCEERYKMVINCSRKLHIVISNTADFHTWPLVCCLNMSYLFIGSILDLVLCKAVKVSQNKKNKKMRTLYEKGFQGWIMNVVCDFITKSLTNFKSEKISWQQLKEKSHGFHFPLSLILEKKFPANFITVWLVSAACLVVFLSLGWVERSQQLYELAAQLTPNRWICIGAIPE